jgi:hypothetical protein
MSTKNCDFARSILRFCFAPEVHHRRLLAILRFDHDRPMLQIGPNLRSCGGKSLPRTHAATNRDFDGMLPGRPLAPIMGLEGGLLSRYLRIMATKR